jgi:hypothetical protein
MPDESWRHIVDDFSATFGITRHSLLESLTFYLLDDHTEAALQVTGFLPILMLNSRLILSPSLPSIKAMHTTVQIFVKLHFLLVVLVICI